MTPHVHYLGTDISNKRPTRGDQKGQRTINIHLKFGLVYFYPMTTNSVEEYLCDVEVYASNIQQLVKQKMDLNKLLSNIASYESRKRELMIRALEAADIIDHCLRCIGEIDSVPSFVSMSNKKATLASEIENTTRVCHELAIGTKQKHEELLDKLAAAKLKSQYEFDVHTDSRVDPPVDANKLQESSTQIKQTQSKTEETRRTKKRTNLPGTGEIQAPLPPPKRKRKETKKKGELLTQDVQKIMKMVGEYGK